jgi:D-tyrosyl-tRNA(Tyr) deacylase
MRAVVQRVTSASVTVDAATVGSIGKGLVVLLGVAVDDSDDDVAFMVRKLVGLRIFGDAEGRMNLSIGDAGGAFLVVSQFTLYGDVSGGNRPSFTGAASGETADRLYQAVCVGLRRDSFDVQTGVFGAHMTVTLVGDGPVTIQIDTRSHKDPLGQ